jgi:hypothetical protein
MASGLAEPRGTRIVPGKREEIVSVQSVVVDGLGLGEEGCGVAAGGGGEQVGEVLVQRAALQAAGGVG